MGLIRFAEHPLGQIICEEGWQQDQIDVPDVHATVAEGRRCGDSPYLLALRAG